MTLLVESSEAHAGAGALARLEKALERRFEQVGLSEWHSPAYALEVLAPFGAEASMEVLRARIEPYLAQRRPSACTPSSSA